MPDALLLADSEVAAVESADSSVWIRFSAAAVERRTGDPAAASFGFSTGLQICVEGAAIRALTPPCIGRIAAGHVECSGQRLRSLTVGSVVPGPLRLELSLANQASLVVAGSGLRVIAAEGACFRESLAC